MKMLSSSNSQKERNTNSVHFVNIGLKEALGAIRWGADVEAAFVTNVVARLQIACVKLRLEKHLIEEMLKEEKQLNEKMLKKEMTKINQMSNKTKKSREFYAAIK